MTESAYIVRIAPSGADKVPEALATGELLIGWSYAEGLLDYSLSWEQFREIMRLQYYSEQDNLRKAGAASGHMWRFIREIKTGDLVVVPYGPDFYVGEITGPARYDPSKLDDDSAYRRPVRWLNNKQPISRQIARSALVSRMKIQGTTADAADLVEDIRECLEIASHNETPTFQTDLQKRLTAEVVKELRSGRIDNFGFERLIHSLLVGLGAQEARIVPRIEDKGADIVATFRVAGTFLQKVAVQAKHWQPEPPVGQEIVAQLINGIEAEGASLGMIVTSGNIGQTAIEAAERYFDEKGIRIELVDGDQFAKLIVEHGMLATMRRAI